MLIIFIAMVLVAAVAASVYITTSSRLQDRALAVGSEARERVSRGLDVVEVLAVANRSTGEVYGFEVLLRPLPSSTSFTQGNLFLRFATRNASFSAQAQHTGLRSFVTSTSPSSVTVSPTSWPVQIVDEEGVGAGVLSYGSGDDLGVGAYGSSLVLLLVTATGDSAVLALDGLQNNTPYVLANASQDAVYGYVNFSNDIYTFSSAMADCDFDTVIRNVRFCLTEVQGNRDVYIDRGELWRLSYRLTLPYILAEGEQFSMTFIPDRGQPVELLITLPGIISSESFTVWP